MRYKTGQKVLIGDIISLDKHERYGIAESNGELFYVSDIPYYSKINIYIINGVGEYIYPINLAKFIKRGEKQIMRVIKD
jgi:hypothetical protein